MLARALLAATAGAAIGLLLSVAARRTGSG